MKTFKGIISILFIFIWMMIIYSFSDMPNEDSNGKSKETIREVIEKTLFLSNKKVEGKNVNLELIMEEWESLFNITIEQIH